MPIKVDELRFIPRGTPAVRRPAGELSVFLDRSDSTLKAIDSQGNIGSVGGRVDTFTLEEAPTPAGNAGKIIFVSDGDDGEPCFAASTGVNWYLIPLGEPLDYTYPIPQSEF